MLADNFAEANQSAQLHISTSTCASISDPEELFNEGQKAYGEGRYEEAFSCFQKAADGFRQIDQKKEVDTRLWMVTMLLDYLYRVSEALKEAEKAANIARNIGYHFGEGICLRLIGDSYLEKHDLIKALEAYEGAQDALETAQEKNSQEDVRDEIIVVVASRGNIYTELGQYRDAVESYDETLNMLKDPRIAISYREKLMAETLRDYGTALMQLGQNEEALAKSQQALGIFQELNDQENIAAVLMVIGGISEELGGQKRNSGYYVKAWGKYKEALDIQRNLKLRVDEIITLNNIGKILDRWAWDAEIPEYHRQALEKYYEALEKLKDHNIDAKNLKGKILSNIGETHLHLSFYEKRPQELDSALNELMKAWDIQKIINDRIRIWLTLSHLGWAYEQQGERQKAIDYSRQSIDIFEDIVQQAGIDEFKISLREQADATYQRLVLLLMASGQFEQAFNVSEQARARVFLDQLEKAEIVCTSDEELLQQKQQLQRELAEIEQRLSEQYEKPEEERTPGLIASLGQERINKRDAYKELLRKIELSCPEYAAMTGINPRKLSDVQAELTRLNSKATLLSYFVTSEKTVAFIITADSFKAVELSVRRAALQATVRRFDDRLEPDNPHPQALQTLYQDLITPLEHHLATRLIGIIPHDALHYVPFAALTDGQQYLCGKYSLFSLPSANILEFVLEERKSGDKNILAMANSDVTGANPLYFAIEEVREIAKLYPGTKVLISDENTAEATEAQFKTIAEDYSIIHLSVHGRLNPHDPLASRIYLTSGDGEDGKLEVHEVYDLRLKNVDLVVLSACETNLGQRSRGDDIIGLTRSFIYAGSSSVIASLWRVNDFAIKELMAAFYKHLQRKSKAEALQAAQQEIRKKFPHPRYWAGFVLTGDPGE